MQTESQIAPQHDAKLHDWRISSVRLLTLRSPNIVEDNIAHVTDRVTRALCDSLEPLMKDSMPEHVLRSLEPIFRFAIKLDLLMQQQRAEYGFSPKLPSKEWSLKFNEETMEITDEDWDASGGKPPLQVDLVVQPSLAKYGDAAGKNYDVVSCLLKSEVKVISGNRRSR